jgi:hypothetical protein
VVPARSRSPGPCWLAASDLTATWTRDLASKGMKPAVARRDRTSADVQRGPCKQTVPRSSTATTVGVSNQLSNDRSEQAGSIKDTTGRPRRAVGPICGPRSSFGTKRSQVQILSPRPVFGLVRAHFIGGARVDLVTHYPTVGSVAPAGRDFRSGERPVLDPFGRSARGSVAR